VAKRTVALNLAVHALDYLTQFGPFGEVLHVETDVVCFGEVVEVCAGYKEEVVGPHGPDCRHFLGRVEVQWRVGVLFGGCLEIWGEGPPRGKVGCCRVKLLCFAVGGDGIYVRGSTCTTCTRDRLNCLYSFISRVFSILFYLAANSISIRGVVGLESRQSQLHYSDCAAALHLTGALLGGLNQYISHHDASP
jgi:hypothetical protein